MKSGLTYSYKINAYAVSNKKVYGMASETARAKTEPSRVEKLMKKEAGCSYQPLLILNEEEMHYNFVSTL